MEPLATILLDPRRLAELGPTEEEIMADLLWPAVRDNPRRSS